MRYATSRHKPGQELDFCLYCGRVIVREAVGHPYNPSWLENPKYTEWWHFDTGLPVCKLDASKDDED